MLMCCCRCKGVCWRGWCCNINIHQRQPRRGRAELKDLLMIPTLLSGEEVKGAMVRKTIDFTLYQNLVLKIENWFPHYINPTPLLWKKYLTMSL